MLHPDIVQLKQFYTSRLGVCVADFIAQAISGLWPGAKGDAMLVIGFGAPYIVPYLTQASPLVVAMPADQGAAAWPAGKDNHVILTHDAELPLQNNSINRVLLVHSVEYSEHLNAMMQEVWRVLVPGGRVLAVVPNRVSFWSGSGKTPFGFGRPFNALQLRNLLTHHHFTPTRSSSALFAPPFVLRLSQRFSRKIEKIGRFFWWFLGGVLIVEAEKQLYASVKEPVFASQSYRLMTATRKTVRVGQEKTIRK
ncbi:MAG: class I SAM-dependent methyltransferase [Alphaproteobacteria bacterium]|nr:class I SAM-dependent methyltransferase [Alphaproteobacteria bacterium]